ncbi:MAG TPA: FIST C-terminal domain-containing protein [Magnetospirillum sp.]|nr:FIST C-terminal domain-containing protein [Magnetospirillum sp.]
MAAGVVMFSVRWLPSLDRPSLEAAFTEWRGEPGHVVALLPDRERAAVPLLQDCARAADISIAGALFPELLVDDRLDLPGGILLHFAVGPLPLLVENVGTEAGVAATASQLAAYVDANSDADGGASLLCIFDAMVPNIATHLDAWYLRLANRVRYSGVNAGNENFAPGPCLFGGERFIGGGVLFQLMNGHPGACLDHGFTAPEVMVAATSAEGNRIVQIDWRPALEVYAELMKAHYGIEIGPDNFYTYAVHFPFGIVRADGEVLVRIPVALSDDGGIVCVGEIPPNSILTLLDARNGARATPATLAEALRKADAPTQGDDLVVFYCAGRRLHKGASVGAELADLARLTGARHLYGALSLGEIGGARSGGYPLFHNAAIVGLPCRKR